MDLSTIIIDLQFIKNETIPGYEKRDKKERKQFATTIKDRVESKTLIKENIDKLFEITDLEILTKTLNRFVFLNMFKIENYYKKPFTEEEKEEKKKEIKYFTYLYYDCVKYFKSLKFLSDRMTYDKLKLKLNEIIFKDKSKNPLEDLKKILDPLEEEYKKAHDDFEREREERRKNLSSDSSDDERDNKEKMSLKVCSDCYRKCVFCGSGPNDLHGSPDIRAHVSCNGGKQPLKCISCKKRLFDNGFFPRSHYNCLHDWTHKTNTHVCYICGEY